MSDEQNFAQEVDSSKDYPHYSVTSRDLPRQIVPQASIFENPPFLQSQFPFTIFARNEQTPDVAKSVNNAFLNEEPGDRLDFGTTTRFPQKGFPEASGSGVTSSKPIENMAPMIEYSYFPRNQASFKTFANIVPTFQSTMSVHASSDREHIQQCRSTGANFGDDFPSYERNTDKHFKKEYPSSDEIENMRKRFGGLLPGGLSGNLQKVDHILSYGREDKRSENDLSSSGKDQYISDITPIDNSHLRFALSGGINPQLRNPDFIGEIDGSFPSQREEKHLENYLSLRGKIEKHYIPNTHIFTNQCLAISERNDNQVRNPDFTDHLLLHKSSSKYLQLYNNTLPENYDFVMNLMAYIEHLNDCSWKETISYFDEYVKRMIKYQWNGLNDFLNSITELQTFDQSTFLNLLDEFTQKTKHIKYDLIKFLNYCVIMSQLGVSARKRNLEDAPMCIITLLRGAIQEYQIFNSILLENSVKKYAEDLVKVLKL